VRRWIMLITCAAVSAASAWSQPFDPFQPAHPIVMGRGGSYTATASGYNSFFYNPAGFARAGEFTISAADVWLFTDKDTISLGRDLGLIPSLARSVSRDIDPAAFADLEDDLQDLSDWVEAEDPVVLETILENALDGTDITLNPGDDLTDVLANVETDDVLGFLEAIDEQAEILATSPLWDDDLIDNLLAELDAALPKGYIRVGGHTGLGYLGNGIGLGLFANVEAVVDGRNLLASTGTAYNTITFVGGFGLSFGTLHLGMALRPTVFGYSHVNVAPVLTGYFLTGALELTSLLANSVYFGSGLGIDVGTVWELGPFSFGAAVKDLFGTRINYRASTIQEYYEALQTATLPLGVELTESELEDAWRIPMKINVGAEFHPNLGVAEYLFDPSVSVDLLDITSAIRTLRAGEQVTGEQILGMLNFGGQIDLFRFLSIRAGYAGGYLSGGIGLDLFFLDINAAIMGDFGRDDTGAWGFSNVGGSVEVALRF
jgi:hypothetical protein